MEDLIEREKVLWITAETGALETQSRVRELPSVNQWIPCDERLPESGGSYICTALDGNERRVTVANYQNKFQRFELSGRRAYWRVVAWMPMPEAYQPD